MQQMIPGVRLSGAAIFAAVMGLVIVATQAGGQSVIAELRWDRAALTEFEWWRLWTGHLVHASWPHVGLNLLGLALVAWLFPEPISARWHFLRFLWLGLASSVMMYVWLPDLDWYVGLSGVLHGCFVIGLWWLFRQGDKLAFLLLVLLGGKLILEHFIGPVTSDEELVGVPVLTQAHSYGALAACLWIPFESWVVFPRFIGNNSAP